jgi:hypothetical protein
VNKTAVLALAIRVLGAPAFVDTWHDGRGTWYGEASNAWGAVYVQAPRRRYALVALGGALRALAAAC